MASVSVAPNVMTQPLTPTVNVVCRPSQSPAATRLMNPTMASRPQEKVMPSIPEVPGLIESSSSSSAPSSNSHNNHAINSNGALKPSELGSSETGSQSQKQQLSGAEMKRRNKAESKARREKQAREKQQQARGQDPSTGQQPLGGKQENNDYSNKTMIMAGEKSQTQSGRDGARGHPSSSSSSSNVREGLKRADSTSVVDGHHTRTLSIRGQVKRGPSNLTNGLKETKEVALFGHLYGQSKRTSLAGVGRDVHATILALGLQMSNYVICGSNARCVATLFCFKKVGPNDRGCYKLMVMEEVDR